MNVESILAGKRPGAVQTIAPEATIQAAIHQLVDHNIGSLVVVNPQGEPIGILTERDILRVCAGGSEALDTTCVREAMTADLIVGEPADAVDYVMGIMTRNRIRHLPIVGAKGLLGMVSIGDVVEVQLQETSYENRHLKSYISGSY